MFRESDLSIICCPACRGDFAYAENKLTCSACGRTYDIVDGIPRLLHFEDESVQYNQMWDYKWTVLDGGNAYNYDLIDKSSEMFQFYGELVSEVEENVKAAGISGSIVSDIGCGSGHYAVLFASLGAERVYALDLTKSVDVAKKIISSRYPHLLDKIVLIQGNAQHLPLKTRSFDISTAIASIHHSGHLEQCLGEVVRVAKDDKYVITWIYGKPYMPFDDTTRTFSAYFKTVVNLLRRCRIEFMYMISKRLPNDVLLFFLRIFASDFVYKHYFRPRYLYRITQFLFPMLPISSKKGNRMINLYDVYSPTYKQTSTEADVINWSRKLNFTVLRFFDWRLGFLAVKTPNAISLPRS